MAYAFIPFWIGVLVGDVYLFAMITGMVDNYPDRYLEVFVTIILLGVICRWMVYPTAYYLVKRWEAVKLNKAEVENARIEQIKRKRDWEQHRIVEIKKDMQDICFHPSIQRFEVEPSIFTLEVAGIACAACGALWKGKRMAPPDNRPRCLDTPILNSANMLMEQERKNPSAAYWFVGPTIPDLQSQVFSKWCRNHISSHTNLPHYEMLLQEIKNGDYYFNLDERPELDYVTMDEQAMMMR